MTATIENIVGLKSAIEHAKSLKPYSNMEISAALVIEIGDTLSEQAKEIEALKAQVEALREAMENLMAFQVKNLDVWNNLPYDICSDLLKSTPTQCLAEIEAQAGRDGYIKGANDWCAPEYVNCNDMLNSSEKHAEQIRQSAKAG